jgi:hypothetical protein
VKKILQIPYRLAARREWSKGEAREAAEERRMRDIPDKRSQGVALGISYAAQWG